MLFSNIARKHLLTFLLFSILVFININFKAAIDDFHIPKHYLPKSV